MLFAWSFDRLIPSFFSNVDDRFHSPVKATIFIIVLGEILTYVFLTFGAGYAAYLTYGLGFAWIVTAWLFVSIAAIVFPYRAKEVYSASVVNRYRIGSIPLVTIVGVLSTGFMLMLTWFFLTDSALGVNSPSQLTLWGTTFLIAAILYPVIYFVRKKQGMDLKHVFAIVPPE
jgi:amino acid transporter